MTKYLTILLLIFFPGIVSATTGSLKYALSVGNSFESGQTVSLTDDSGKQVAAITYGETGGADFSAAIADSHLDGYPAYTAGNGTNGNASGGTFYVIEPSYDGTVSIAVVLNSDKSFFILEDGTALDDYNGIKVTEKYYGTYSFEVIAGKAYKVYCAGSKLGFYGLQYVWDDNTGEQPGGDTSDDQEEDYGIGTGRTYYASPTGTSSTGTSVEAPGRLTTMVGKLTPGDILYLLDGQYDLSDNLKISKSGTANKYIAICAYQDAKPILDFRTAANKINGVTVSGSYLYIEGLTVRYSGYKGIWVEKGTHNILENLDVYGCCNAGIQLRSGGNNYIINCDAHDNFDYQDNGGNADGFADKQGDACPGNVYIGCRAWGNSDDGWDSFQRVTSGSPTVYINCITYNNGPATFNLTKHPRVLGVDKNLSCFAGKNLAQFANGGNPNGFKLGGQGTAHNTELYRCLAIGHRSKGFDQNNNAGKMKIVNCTALRNNLNYGFGNNYAYTLYLYNNISVAPTGGSSNHLKTASAGTVVQGNNSWNSGYAVTDAYFETLDVSDILGEVDEFGNQLLKARNADGSLPEIKLMHLTDKAVNAIDKGRSYTAFDGERIAGYVAYEGAAPDLGCFEYVTPNLQGDVNEDGSVDINDVVAIINHMAGTATWRYADVNADTKVDINDVVAVINIMAGN